VTVVGVVGVVGVVVVVVGVSVLGVEEPPPPPPDAVVVKDRVDPFVVPTLLVADAR
jgi:hypothetical protein